MAENSSILKKQFHQLLMLWLGLVAAAAFAADPTQPPPWLQQTPVTAAVADVPLRVQQILIREGDNRAVINSRLVRTGDLIDGAQVMAIYADKVVVNIRQKRHELSLLINTRHISE